MSSLKLPFLSEWLIFCKFWLSRHKLSSSRQRFYRGLFWIIILWKWYLCLFRIAFSKDSYYTEISCLIYIGNQLTGFYYQFLLKDISEQTVTDVTFLLEYYYTVIWNLRYQNLVFSLLSYAMVVAVSSFT